MNGAALLRSADKSIRVARDESAALQTKSIVTDQALSLLEAGGTN
jgi:hypothetical protein